MAGGYIYILGSQTGTRYIGVTSNLYLRVMQYNQGTLEGFTAAYGCNRLLYFEGYEDMWLKSSELHRQDKHPRGPSTPRHEVLCRAINL